MLTSGRILALALAATLIIGGLGIVGMQEVEEEQEDEIFNPSLITWRKVESDAPWSARDSHGVIVYRDKIWLFGGLNGNGYVVGPERVEYGEAPHFSDIWVSEDGISWEMLEDRAPWGERRSIQAAVFQEKLWLIPGWGPFEGSKSEVWYSEDGTNWTKAATTPNWPAREGHQLVVFQDKLWLIGGVDYNNRETKNDVWYSEDGINWIEATKAAPWPSRWDHEVIVFKDRLWLIGGMDLAENVYGDIWVSEDGKSWSLVSEKPLFAARQGHELVVFKDRIWVVGRLNTDSQGGGKNDVWFSDDGISWLKTKKDPSWSGREDHAAVIFRDKIWVLGGMTSDWTWQKDVWFSTFEP